jgi:hypothetical protein
MVPGLKLGKLPATHDRRDLKLVDFIDRSKLPTPPEKFGHDGLVKAWPMLGNDQYGDCVWAGAAHEVQQWNADAGRTVTFTNEAVLSDYAACTGFDPNDPSTDQGTDMRAAAKYRKATGIVDAAGTRHKIGAYVTLTPGDVNELKIAIMLFGLAGGGLVIDTAQMTQFNDGQPFDWVSGSPQEGGHYVPINRWDAQYLGGPTWEREEPMTYRFYEKQNDETFVYLSDEMLTGGTSIDGFARADLIADLRAL